MLLCLIEVVEYQMPFGGLKCRETYEAQNDYHGCSNCTEFLTYKNGKPSTIDRLPKPDLPNRLLWPSGFLSGF